MDSSTATPPRLLYNWLHSSGLLHLRLGRDNFFFFFFLYWPQIPATQKEHLCVHGWKRAKTRVDWWRWALGLIIQLDFRSEFSRDHLVQMVAFYLAAAFHTAAFNEASARIRCSGFYSPHWMNKRSFRCGSKLRSCHPLFSEYDH